MKTLTQVFLVLSVHAGLVLCADAQTNLAGVYRPATAKSSPEIAKLVINGDKSVDIELKVVEVERSMRLGKAEWTNVEKNVEVAGKVELQAPEAFFDDMKKKADAPDAVDVDKKIAATCDLYRGMGYDSLVIIRLPDSTQFRPIFFFLHKEGTFVDFLTGAKLKKAWW